MMKKRVAVAMSGGVDSSVAAALLKAKGYEVVGLTMCFASLDAGGGKSGQRPSCCGAQGIADAQRVSGVLGIRHYVVSMQRQMEEYVVRDLCACYQRGMTPNPCIRCNQYVKFGALFKKAMALDAQSLATGHYARVVKRRGGDYPEGVGYLLKKAKDRKKDQSYFLYRLAQEQLPHILFPLGGYTKDQVRVLAKEFKLPVAEKKESQEICFVPGNDYREFVKERFPGSVKPGDVVDIRGKRVGSHQGISFYTVGQREGLRIPLGYPAYVVRLDARANRIVVGPRDQACAKGCFVREPHFITGMIKKKVAVQVRIRYNHKETLALIQPCRGRYRIEFKRPQFAVTPGQSAVFYKGDTVLGGGIIEEAILNLHE